MPSEITKQRKLAAIIPLGGTDRVGYSALRRWVLPCSIELLSGKVWS